MILNYSVSVADIPPQGLEAHVSATEEQCATLAAELDLPAVHRLEGRYRLTHAAGDRIHVAGSVEADVRQICVVTLDPIETRVVEEVDLDFAPESSFPEASDDDSFDEDSFDVAALMDGPDVIENGAIDLGALTIEFLALGLDPYPRKPDAVLPTFEDSEAETPFAALAKLRGDAADEGR